jgi:Tol biopolymer transport system component
MDADGSNRRLAGEGVAMPLWSPDGHQFLIVGFNDPSEMTLLNVDKPNLQPIRIPGQQVFGWPRWADVGTLVAVVGSDRTGDAVALLDVSQPERAKIKEVVFRADKDSGLRPLWPVYSPSTRRCVFVGVGPEGMALYSIEPGQAGKPKRLEAGPLDGLIGGLGFSPDGRYLLFCSTRLGSARP